MAFQLSAGAGKGAFVSMAEAAMTPALRRRGEGHECRPDWRHGEGGSPLRGRGMARKDKIC